MAKIIDGARRGRPGKWLVDWRDALGHRRLTTCDTREDAAQRLAIAKRESTMRRQSYLDPRLTVAELVDLWRDLKGPMLRPQSLVLYESHLKHHILPIFGDMRVVAVGALVIERWVARLKGDGYAEGTICTMVALLRTILGVAVRHNLLAANPARGIVREVGLTRYDRTKIKAPTEEELAHILTTAREIGVDLYERLAFLADTAARSGEALAVRWDDLDLNAQTLTFNRQMVRGRGITSILKTPTSQGVIQIPAGLVEVLRARRARLRTETFARGAQLSPWVMVPEWGEHDPTPHETNVAYQRLYDGMREATARAGFEGRFSPHSLRHSYCARHLASNLSPAWVQKQARHSSIATTVDGYGSWLPHKRPKMLDELGMATSTISS